MRTVPQASGSVTPSIRETELAIEFAGLRAVVDSPAFMADMMVAIEMEGAGIRLARRRARAPRVYPRARTPRGRSRRTTTSSSTATSRDGPGDGDGPPPEPTPASNDDAAPAQQSGEQASAYVCLVADLLRALYQPKGGSS